MDEKVEVIAKAEALPGKEAEVEAILQKYLAPTRIEDGCIVYNLYKTAEPGTFYFYEIWSSQAALAKHAQSEHLKVGKKALEGLMKGPTQVSILTEVKQ